MWKQWVQASLAIPLLAGCQNLSEPADKMMQLHQERAESAESQLAHFAAPPALIRDRHDFLGVLEVGGHGDRLPARCDQTIVLRSVRPLGLDEVSARLAQILQVAVQFDSEESASPPGKTPREGPPNFPIGEAPPAKPFPVSANMQLGPQFQPDFSGSCKDLLDRVAGHFNVDWRMRGGVLWFDHQLVRTFPIKASAATAQISSTMTSGGNGAGGATAPAPGGAAAPGNGGTGGSSQSASVSVNSDIWPEIDAGLKTLMASAGRYSISRASGTVTVVASPRTMGDVEKYLDRMNKILSTTIAVEVSAIYITVDDTDNYGLDLNLLYQVGAKSVRLNGLLPSITQAPGTGSIAILSPPPGSNNFSTHFAGSQLFLNAVSSSNRLADYRSATVTGRNGVAMPITLATNQDIVRSLQFAVGLQSGAASTSASTSTINYGFSLQVLPRVIGPDVINVFLSFTANDLTNLQDFAVGTAGSLELATIDSRSLWNESPLRAGQTLVIAGTEQEKVVPQRSGIGAASNWLLGGQLKNEVIRTRLILLVTPSIMATPS